MNEIYVLQKDELGGEFYRRIYLLIRQNRWTRPSMGATFGLAGGMFAIILGTLLWIAVSILAAGSFRASLNLLEIVLFALALPLLALGAYCLDLLEQKFPSPPAPAESQSHSFKRSNNLRPQQPDKN